MSVFRTGTDPLYHSGLFTGAAGLLLSQTDFGMSVISCPLYLESECHNTACVMYPMIRFLSGTPMRGLQQMACTSLYMQIYSLGMFTYIVIMWTSVAK